jgi:hypothetical protein
LLLVLALLVFLSGGRKGKGGKGGVVPIGPPGDLGVTYYPVTGSAKTISGYGPRGSSFHYGVDLGAPAGRAVVACVTGSVRYGTDAKGGNVAIVTSTDGTAFYYAHLSAFEGSARKVSAGDVIGFVGMTGNAATTVPHLHFELWPTGSYTPTPPDPTPFLQTAKRSPAQSNSAGVAAANDGTAAVAPAGSLPSNVIPIWGAAKLQQTSVQQALSALTSAKAAYDEAATTELDAQQQQELDSVLQEAAGSGSGSVNLNASSVTADVSPEVQSLFAAVVAAQAAYLAAVKQAGSGGAAPTGMAPG